MLAATKLIRIGMNRDTRVKMKAARLEVFILKSQITKKSYIYNKNGVEWSPFVPTTI